MKVSVIVHPNSKHPRIETDLFGGLHIYVAAPPQDGKANAAVQEVLADHYGVAKSQVILEKGHTSKYKQFKIA